MDPYSNYQNMNNIHQQIYLQNRQFHLQNQQMYLQSQQIYLQNQYCYPVHFQPNLQSYNSNYCYNAPTVYPLMRIPNNQLTLQNVSLNNSKSNQQKEIKNPVKHMSILNEKNKEFYKCDLCEYKSIRKGSLKTHLMLIHNVGDFKWYSCNHCNYKTKVKASLSKHEMLKHNIGNRPIIWYHCSKLGCKYKARQKSHIKEHERNVHDIGENILWHICKQPNCSYKTKHKGSFDRHLKNVHKINLSQKLFYKN